jgi:hypothetical protein
MEALTRPLPAEPTFEWVAIGALRPKGDDAAYVSPGKNPSPRRLASLMGEGTFAVKIRSPPSKMVRKIAP